MNEKEYNNILKIVSKELKKKTFPYTKQFLKVHKIEFENGLPIVENIIKNENDEIKVFLKVKGEKFFFSINIFENEVSWVSDEPYISVWFRADSKEKSLKELSKFSKLKYNFGRNKGDVKGLEKNKVYWKESIIFFNPYSEIDQLHPKIDKLLDFIEKDKKGISKLINEADGFVDVFIIFYIGNTMIGNIDLDEKIIKRLSKLNLTINFTLEVSGKKFK